MRQGQQNRRGRGRSNSNNNNSNHGGSRKQQNPLARSYESNGPDVKIRGSATQIAEKYMTLARDASSIGDIVMAENYLQHAEHYNRIIMAAQAQSQAQPQNQAQPQVQQPSTKQPEQDSASAPKDQDAPAAANDAIGDQPQPQIQPAGTEEQPDIVPVPAAATTAAEKKKAAPPAEEEGAQPVRRRRRRYPSSTTTSSRAGAAAAGVENANGHANGADIPSEAQPSSEAIA
ncbi:MAG: DUF4167 domain-containing protein [Alphaproteobacteria bacterium]